MDEFSYRFNLLGIPRALYKQQKLRTMFRFNKLRKPLRYSLLQIAYACLGEVTFQSFVDSKMNVLAPYHGFIFTTAAYYPC